VLSIIQFEKIFFSDGIPLLKDYLTGSAIFVYWYIPFIMIIFFLSPFFVRFIELKHQTQIAVAIGFLICSVFLHRGTFQNQFSVFQNVLYFVPVYMFGIISSINKDIIYSKFSGKEYYLLLLVIALALIQSYTGQSGNYHKDAFSFHGIDLMIIQKIIFCLFFMTWLYRYENRKIKYLNIIAENSFGIFFIHGILILIFFKIKTKIGISLPQNYFLVYCLVVFFVFSNSLFLTLLFRNVFSKKSKYLIGS